MARQASRDHDITAEDGVPVTLGGGFTYVSFAFEVVREREGARESRATDGAFEVDLLLTEQGKKTSYERCSNAAACRFYATRWISRLCAYLT